MLSSSVKISQTSFNTRKKYENVCVCGGGVRVTETQKQRDRETERLRELTHKGAGLPRRRGGAGLPLEN